MGFNDKDGSPLDRIVSQIDGGVIREDVVSQRISPHDVMYHRYHAMRNMQERHFSERPTDENLSEGYQPLRKRVPLSERTSPNFVESDSKSDPLATPLAGSQPLRKRLPASLAEIRSQAMMQEEFVDPSVAIEEEARLEAEAARLRQQRQRRTQDAKDGNLNESFDERPKRRKPLDLDMPIANRDGLRVSEAAPTPRRKVQPTLAEDHSSRGFVETPRSGRPEADLSSFLRGLGSRVNPRDVDEGHVEDGRTKEDIFRDDQSQRNRRFTEGAAPVGKTRRRVESQQPVRPEPVVEEAPVKEEVEDVINKLGRTFAESDTQGMKLFEDILHDYVSLAYVAHRGMKPVDNEDPEIDQDGALEEV